MNLAANGNRSEEGSTGCRNDNRLTNKSCNLVNVTYWRVVFSSVCLSASFNDCLSVCLSAKSLKTLRTEFDQYLEKWAVSGPRNYNLLNFCFDPLHGSASFTICLLRRSHEYSHNRE